MTKPAARDHGGGLDAAVSRFGGARADWIDLSTGINPTSFPVPELTADAWTALPDSAAMTRLIDAARAFWNVPNHLDVLAAPGASSLIAQLPRLANAGTVRIDAPTYNEYAAAFHMHGWEVSKVNAAARVVVHPNNPTGAFWDEIEPNKLTIIDESFCDVAPNRSLIDRAGNGTLVLKSFGKFWGLAGVRLGFLIGDTAQVDRVRQWQGPWAVSGAAMEIGAHALADHAWANAMRAKLEINADRLDQLVTKAGADLVGGTSLFRLYAVDNAATWQDRLAQHHIWSRIFPYSKTWLRLGLPPAHGWDMLKAAL